MEDEKEATIEEQEEQFEAGRAAARGEAQKEEADLIKEDKEDKAAGEEEAPPAKLIAGLTEEELAAVLSKANRFDDLQERFDGETRKLHGKFGELHRELKKLSEGRPGRITKESLKRISAEAGDEFAAALADDLGNLPGGESFDSTELESRISQAMEERESKLSRSFETKLLSLRHPDWQEKRQSPEYDLWFGTLPTDRQKEIKTSVDGLFVAKALDDFDTWRKKGKTKERLERAIVPTGAPAPTKETITDEAAFEEGRKAARRRLGLMR